MKSKLVFVFLILCSIDVFGQALKLEKTVKLEIDSIYDVNIIVLSKSKRNLIAIMEFYPKNDKIIGGWLEYKKELMFKLKDLLVLEDMINHRIEAIDYIYEDYNHYFKLVFIYDENIMFQSVKNIIVNKSFLSHKIQSIKL